MSFESRDNITFVSNPCRAAFLDLPYSKPNHEA